MRTDIHGDRWEWVVVSSLLPGDRVILECGGHHYYLTVSSPHRHGAWTASDSGIVISDATDTIERSVAG